MRVSSILVAAAVFVLVLGGIAIGFALSDLQTRRVQEPQPETTRVAPARVDLPEEDVPGKEIEGLPRCPGSVRVEHQHERDGALVTRRVRYLARASLDECREFYREVFRSEDWSVANFEVSEAGWHFLVVQGEREALIDIERLGGGILEIDIELSGPRETEAPEEPDSDVQEEPAPQPEQAPAPQPEPVEPAPVQPAPVEPAPVEPAPQPAPGDDVGDDAGDDLGDDGGEDD